VSVATLLGGIRRRFSLAVLRAWIRESVASSRPPSFQRPFSRTKVAVTGAPSGRLTVARARSEPSRSTRVTTGGLSRPP
jgi:hypothetical protein